MKWYMLPLNWKRREDVYKRQVCDFTNNFQFTCVVVELSLNICKAVDTGDDFCSILAQTVQDTTQKMCIRDRSGGVDSSVVVHLLCEQGHRPSLFYIKIGKDAVSYTHLDVYKRQLPEYHRRYFPSNRAE